MNPYIAGAKKIWCVHIYRQRRSVNEAVDVKQTNVLFKLYLTCGKATEEIYKDKKFRLEIKRATFQWLYPFEI
jgi:hypothetical protein